VGCRQSALEGVVIYEANKLSVLVMSSFEDLEVWQQSKELTVLVLQEISKSNTFMLWEQLSKLAISIPSNIAEGAERTD
jgi:hypothetical protein